MAVPRSRVDLVPPPQPHEPPPGDVLQVVEIRGQEEHGDDEDEHEAGREEPEAEEVYQKGCWGVKKKGGGKRSVHGFSEVGVA